MTWLALNNIDLSALASASESPEEGRRDIGEVGEAGNGALVPSAIARKHDLSFGSIALTGVDAYAWEGLVTGLGEHWSFNSNLYGSRGLGPTGSLVATQTAGTPKFGAGVLRVSATTGTITFAAAATDLSGNYNTKWTVMVWRYEAAVWHHYIVTSSAKRWVDGVRNDAASTTWLGVNASGDVTIANTTGAAVDYDDLVVLPYEILTTWAPIFGVATTAFSNLPYMTATGDLVPEAASRQMVGAAVLKVFRGTSGGTVKKDMKRLTVTLREA